MIIGISFDNIVSIFISGFITGFIGAFLIALWLECKGAKMLNGNEKIKDISNNDICNYIGNNTKGAKTVEIKIENYGAGDYRVLYVEYQDGVKTRIAFNNNKANNSTIEEIRTLCLFSRKQYFNSLRGQNVAN